MWLELLCFFSNFYQKITIETLIIKRISCALGRDSTFFLLYIYVCIELKSCLHSGNKWLFFLLKEFLLLFFLFYGESLSFVNRKIRNNSSSAHLNGANQDWQRRVENDDDTKKKKREKKTNFKLERVDRSSATQFSQFHTRQLFTKYWVFSSSSPSEFFFF